MSVTLLIISHEEIGSALVQTATAAFEELPLPTTVVSVSRNCNPEDLIKKLKKLLSNIQSVDGVLILTDLFGSTPSNIAQALKSGINIKMVSGLNLPMLMRVMNYHDLSLDALSKKALSGGKDGVISL